MALPQRSGTEVQKPDLIWERKWPNSTADYDLALKNPEAVNRKEIMELLESTASVTHRKLTLSGGAARAWSRWLNDPSAPLESEAFVLLSNWFLSRGDSTSALARHCETFWDTIFACRPPVRLSSPERGRNHKVVPEAFDRFWRELVEAQAESAPDENNASDISVFTAVSPQPPNTDYENRFGMKKVSIRIVANGVSCEAEGLPAPISDLLKYIATWNGSLESLADVKHCGEAGTHE